MTRPRPFARSHRAPEPSARSGPLRFGPLLLPPSPAYIAERATTSETAVFALAEAAPDSELHTGVTSPRQTAFDDGAALADRFGLLDLQKGRPGIADGEEEFWVVCAARRVMTPIHGRFPRRAGPCGASSLAVPEPVVRPVRAARGSRHRSPVRGIRRAVVVSGPPPPGPGKVSPGPTGPGRWPADHSASLISPTPTRIRCHGTRRRRAREGPRRTVINVGGHGGRHTVRGGSRGASSRAAVTGRSRIGGQERRERAATSPTSDVVRVPYDIKAVPARPRRRPVARGQGGPTGPCVQPRGTAAGHHARPTPLPYGRGHVEAFPRAGSRLLRVRQRTSILAAFSASQFSKLRSAGLIARSPARSRAVVNSRSKSP